MIPGIKKAEADPKEACKEKKVSFELRNDEYGGTHTVAIMAIDEDGEEWYVGLLCSDGLHLLSDISKESGIPTDESGYIEVIRD